LDLGQVLINASSSFTLGVQLTLLLGAVFGVWVTGRGMMDIYILAAGDNRFSNRQPSIFGGFIRLMLGGAMIVAPALLWIAANTFVAGGTNTEALFNYSSSSGTSYCDQIRVAVSYLFMLVGVIAWFKAGAILHDNASGGGMAQRSGSPMLYFVGGVLTFFITDVSTILTNTLGISVGLSNVCTALQ